jgi:hypothetical protein
MNGHLFTKNALEWVFGMGNRGQSRRVAQLTERVRCDSARTVRLQAGDSMCESFESHDTLCVFWQELKAGNCG